MRIAWKWTPCLLLAAATVAGNGRDVLADWRAARRMARTWEGRAFRGNGLHSDLRRERAEQHVPAGEAIYLMVNDGQDPSPMTRIIHQTLSWSRAPGPVAFGPPEGYGGEPFIMTAPFDALPDFASPRGRTSDFDVVRNGPVSLWRRRGHAGAETDGGAPAGPPRRAPSGILAITPGREALGLAAPLLAVLAAVLPWERLRQVRRRSHTACVPDAPGDPWQAGVWSLLLLSLVMLVPVLAGIQPDAGLTLAAALACGAGARVSRCAVSTPRLGGSGSAAPGTRIAVAALVALFVLAAGIMTCSHTFLAPNGLGVQGGKARLLYLAGGLPDGFFTGAAHRTLQPAYPPGCCTRLITGGRGNECYVKAQDKRRVAHQRDEPRANTAAAPRASRAHPVAKRIPGCWRPRSTRPSRPVRRARAAPWRCPPPAGRRRRGGR